jgi:hypothetical protein
VIRGRGNFPKKPPSPYLSPEWTGADGEIAAAWHRLRTGRGTDTDKLLLKHETAKMWLRTKKGLDYSAAHNAANQRWNWQDALPWGWWR